MDFALLPPEINSTRMYTGPGAGPMLAAATAWDYLAAELQSAASSYQSVLTGLLDMSWRGPSSASMVAAAAPYVAWLAATGARAEQTASQAKAAAHAYEAAFALTVPPSAVVANRAQLAALVASNVLGQNTAAIAATETAYSAMWAQDAVTMYGYAGSAAAASALSPFTAPPKTTGSAAPAGQAAATAQATGSAASSQLHSVASALAGLPAGTDANAAGLVMDEVGLGIDTVGLTAMEAPGLGTEFAGLGIEFGGLGIELIPQMGMDALGGLGALGSLGGLGGGLAGLASSTILVSTAAVGQAASIGGALSVPPSWANAAPLASLSPSFQLTATALPPAGGAAQEVLTGAAGNTFSDMAMAGAAGRAVGGTASLGRRVQTGFVPRQPGRPAQEDQERETPMATVAEVRELADLLRNLADLRDSGTLTDDEFAEQKQRLLGR